MPSQFARPIADQTGFDPGDYTPQPGWPVVDEATPDDTDFIHTDLNNFPRLTLSRITAPFSGSTATLRARSRVTVGGGSAQTVGLFLYRISVGSILTQSPTSLLSIAVSASFQTSAFEIPTSVFSGFEADLGMDIQLTGRDVWDVSWVEFEAPPTSVVTGPFPPVLHTPYPQQTYGGTVVPILWSYSTFSGPGSQTTPSIDISFSTDCGISWSTLSSGIEWTSTITLTGYAWDSTDSAMTVTNCARVRIRESNDTPSSWVTSGNLFPPRIWIPPPISTATESWSRETISLATWTVSECATAQTWVAPSIDSATWGASGCSSAVTWFSIGI